MRYFDVFRKSLLYGALTTLVEPLLWLGAFGFGMGALVGTIEAGGITLTYRQFIFAGILGQTVLFQGFFESAYGSFIRMYYQRIFQAMSVTPITLSEVLWAELLWDASKGTFASFTVLLVGVISGDFSIWGAAAALPVCFICSYLFAGLGLWVAAISKNIEQISYPQYLLVFPMFLFCGVFYPVETLPDVIEVVAWSLPLTSVVSLFRTLVLGLPFVWWTVPILAFWLLLLTWISRRTMTRRLVK